jgi:HTH-like domain
MRLIDEQFLETPWYGSRQMARHLRRNGWCVGRHRVRRLIAQDGFGADPPAPEDQRTASAASDMALSASPSDHRPAEPGLVRRRDLHPDAQRLPVHRRDHALVQPKGSDMETIEHGSQPTIRSLKPITRRSTPSRDSFELFSGTTCWKVRTSVFVTPSFAVYPFLAPHTVSLRQL